MSRHHRLPTLALLLAAPSLVAAGATMGMPPDRAEPFDEAEVFVELNDTDGDLGLHASVDGGPWTAIAIEGGNDRMLLEIEGSGELRRQGLTQLFFESAEPTFDELDPAAFFARFPEGTYTIVGRGHRGEFFRSQTILSHVLAAPPRNVYVSGLPAAPSCDDELPEIIPPVRIEWDPVVDSHPTIGRAGAVEIRRYQLFVERDNVSLAIDLPPGITMFEVPTAITDLGDEFKFEIIAQTSTGNNTAVESCFELH